MTPGSEQMRLFICAGEQMRKPLRRKGKSLICSLATIHTGGEQMKGSEQVSGRKSQRKGAGGERELAALLRGYGYNIERGGSCSFGEVPDLSGLPGVHIECKRTETLRLSEWMSQSVRDSERFRDGMPCVFHRKSREPWLVTMRLSDWMALYNKSEN